MYHGKTDRPLTEDQIIGAAFRALRVANGLPMPAMAERLDMSIATLRNAEYGRRNPGQYIRRVCQVLHLTLAEFEQVLHILGRARARMQAESEQQSNAA